MMKRLTAEKIAELTDDKDGLANVRAINKLYREQDQSHLWPIRGRFNATERAIRKIRHFARHNGSVLGLEYAYALDQEISNIVNNENNW